MSDGEVFFTLAYLVVFMVIAHYCYRLTNAVESIAKSLGKPSDGDKPKE